MPDAPPSRVALALGGNLGDAAAAFVYALERLNAALGARVAAVSSVYRTPPWGLVDQPDFLNMAALLETVLDPRAVLSLCLAIEAERGRVRSERWGPRPLDLDIIDYDGRSIAEPALTLPHPRAGARGFVLIPLAEIAPDLRLGGTRVRDLAAACDASGIVRDEAASARVAASMSRKPCSASDKAKFK